METNPITELEQKRANGDPVTTEDLVDVLIYMYQTNQSQFKRVLAKLKRMYQRQENLDGKCHHKDFNPFKENQ